MKKEREGKAIKRRGKKKMRQFFLFFLTWIYLELFGTKEHYVDKKMTTQIFCSWKIGK